MNFLNSMLGAAFSWGALFSEGGALVDPKWEWVQSLMVTLSTVLWVVLALVGAAGGIYAIYVGIKMARAESAEQRDENKKRMINIIVSIVVVIVLILFFNNFLPAILSAFGIFKTELDDPYAKTETISTIVNTAKVFLHM